MNDVLLLQYVENYGENFHRDVSYAVAPFFALSKLSSKKASFSHLSTWAALRRWQEKRSLKCSWKFPNNSSYSFSGGTIIHNEFKRALQSKLLLW